MKVVLAILIVLISSVYASAQEARVVERLESGAYVVEIDGVLHQALPPNKIREILADRDKLNNITARFDALVIEVEKYKTLIQQIREEDRKIFELELQKVEEQRKFYSTQYEAELKLRNDFARKVKRCSGRFLGVRLCWF